MRIEQLCQEFDLKLRWTVFPLHPETPDEGRELADLFSGRMNVSSVMAELKSLAQSLGLPFGERTRTYNSRLAQELGKWAEQQGKGDAFRAAIYQAYFAEGQNIARPKLLLEICRTLGLAVSEAQKVLGQRLYSAEVDADWERAGRFGIRSVPSHIYLKRMLVGFQDYPAFQRLISGT